MNAMPVLALHNPGSTRLPLAASPRPRMPRGCGGHSVSFHGSCSPGCVAEDTAPVGSCCSGLPSAFCGPRAPAASAGAHCSASLLGWQGLWAVVHLRGEGCSDVFAGRPRASPLVTVTRPKWELKLWEWQTQQHVFLCWGSPLTCLVSSISFHNIVSPWLPSLKCEGRAARPLQSV